MVDTLYDPNTFDRLKIRFGNHSAVARELGISPVYYRYLRRTKQFPKHILALMALIEAPGASIRIEGAGLAKENFDRLRIRFGSHSAAARHLGLSVTGYRRVRRTLTASPPIIKLIRMIYFESGPH